MSAEVLRQAASVIRARAEAASSSSPAPWSTDSEVAHRMPAPFGVIYFDDDGRGVSVAESYSMAEVEHIASWHPAVALAVADWLVTVAERQIDSANTGAIFGGTDWEAALSVARAYLGSDQ